VGESLGGKGESGYSTFGPPRSPGGMHLVCGSVSVVCISSSTVGCGPNPITA
jgi:hypothetical protein